MDSAFGILQPMKDPACEIRILHSSAGTDKTIAVEFYCLMLLRSGVITVQINGSSYRAEHGSLLLFSPGDRAAVQKDSDFSCYEICLGTDCARNWSTYRRLDAVACFRSGYAAANRVIPLEIEEYERLDMLCSQYCKEEDGRFGSDFYRTGMVGIAFVFANRIFLRTESSGRLTEEPLAARVRRYIDHHYSEDLSISRLASLFFVNESHLMHTFKKNTGMSVHQYAMDRRLRRAAELLAAGEKPTEVFPQCGFGDYTSFFRHFKSRYGVSPREYNTNR